MWWRLTGHQIEYFLFYFGCTGTGLHFVLFLLRLLFAPLHCTLVFGHHTFRPHAHRQTLFQPALLTLASHVHVHFAGMTKFATINRIFGDAPSKETLAAFTGKSVVVIAGRPIAAHQTQFFLQTGRRTFFDFLNVAGIAGWEAIQTARRWKIVATWRNKNKQTKINKYFKNLFLCISNTFRNNKRILFYFSEFYFISILFMRFFQPLFFFQISPEMMPFCISHLNEKFTEQRFEYLKVF